MLSLVQPSGIEQFFDEDEIIVSKTDPKGIITYANPVFIRLSGYREEELLGQPHNLIRHPDMPGSVFRLLWDTISSGREIFAYVKNMSRNGDHYWVLAHVTPTLDASGQIIGYHSNRRVPERDAVEAVSALYRDVLREERKYSNRKEAVDAGMRVLSAAIGETGIPYEEFIFSL